MKLVSRFFKRKKEKEKKVFDPKKRVDSENLTEKEKMDRGFNGKTYTINGIENDF